MIKNTEARLVDQTGAIYRLTPTVHMVSSDEIVLSTGTRFRCVHRGPNGQIPAEVAQELVLEGWLERIVRETAVEPLVLPSIVTGHWTATLVMPESLACDPLIEAWASKLRRRGLSGGADLAGRGYAPGQRRPTGLRRCGGPPGAGSALGDTQLTWIGTSIPEDMNVALYQPPLVDLVDPSTMGAPLCPAARSNLTRDTLVGSGF